MRVLKTIVATAVIVFALTTVAMAGVQHITKSQSAQAAVRAPVHHAVTLATQRRNATHVRRAHSQASAAHRVAHEARAQHVDHGQGSDQSTSDGQSNSHHQEPTHHTYASGNGHAGDRGDNGGQCGD
jgi:hypothetical protein